MQRPLRMLSLGALAVALAASGCAKNTRTDTGVDEEKSHVQTASLAANSDGPAPDVAGAKKGGTITVLMHKDFEHLDPAQNYVNVQQIAGQLLYRSLTAFREQGKGKLEVVGDLATNTGEKSDGGKTWTFRLKDGLKFEDGRPITSKEVAYGVARTFSPELPNGPHFIQQWLAGDLDYNKIYKGPYNGGAEIPPGVETPDEKTIVFKFNKPQPDMPFAAALPTTSPVPKDKDTKKGYDNRPFSSGPYKVETYNRGAKLTLVRNEHWDATTDPLRHAYPDRFEFAIGSNAVQTSERLVADTGSDQTALTWMSVPPEVLPKVVDNTELTSRVIEGNTQYNRYLNINTQRVTDLKVRQALNYAIDRENLLKVYGPKDAVPGTTLLSPTVSGFQKYNAYDGGKNGNVKKAKELLGGKTVKLVLGYGNTERGQKIAAFLKSNFEKAGFEIDMQPIDGDQYYSTVGKKDNQYDLYMGGWGSDWPLASTVIPPLFDGREIGAEGNQNLSYFNADDVNAKIDELKAMEPAEAAKGWAELDEEIMRKYAPLVPLTYERNYTLIGSKVGGAFLSDSYGATSLLNIFVK